MLVKLKSIANPNLKTIIFKSMKNIIKTHIMGVIFRFVFDYDD